MNNQPNLRCFCCGKVGFASYSEYRDHILTDHSEEENVLYVLCPLCNFPVRDIRSHCKLKHPNQDIPKVPQMRARVWKDWDGKNRKMVRSKKGKGKRNWKDGFFLSKKNSFQAYHYRSSWELRVMECLESFPEVVSWQSEPFPIKYTLHGKERFYLPDFIINYDDSSSLLVEVKPKHEAKDPDEMNQAKWVSAQQYCFARGWKFEVWTENYISEIDRRRRSLVDNQNLKSGFPDITIL